VLEKHSVTESDKNNADMNQSKNSRHSNASNQILSFDNINKEVCMKGTSNLISAFLINS
jgi:hypothetical protein